MTQPSHPAHQSYHQSNTSKSTDFHYFKELSLTHSNSVTSNASSIPDKTSSHQFHDNNTVSSPKDDDLSIGSIENFNLNDNNNTNHVHNNTVNKPPSSSSIHK